MDPRLAEEFLADIERDNLREEGYYNPHTKRIVEEMEEKARRLVSDLDGKA